jgi:hypothetical protein
MTQSLVRRADCKGQVSLYNRLHYVGVDWLARPQDVGQTRWHSIAFLQKMARFLLEPSESN